MVEEPVRNQYRDGVAAHGHIPNVSRSLPPSKIKRRSRFVEHSNCAGAEERALIESRSFLLLKPSTSDSPIFESSP